MKYDVVVVADLCLDLLLLAKVKPQYGQAEQLVDDYIIELGGSAAIFSSQFSKLGGKVGLIGAVGEDDFGSILLKKLSNLGISTKYISVKPEVKTSLGLGLSYFEDRAMLTYAGSLKSVTPEEVLGSEILSGSSHLHIAGYFLLDQLYDFWPKILKNLSEQNITSSLDTNWSLNDNWEKVKELLPYINVFLPNEEEAKRISGEQDIINAGKYLSKFSEVVVIKRGEKGAIVFHENDYFDEPVPKELSENLKIRDTTGAGDNFDAGFLMEWLKNKPLKECALTGIKCGTLSLAEMGGIKGQYQL